MTRIFREKFLIAIRVLIFLAGILIFLWFLQKKTPWYFLSITGILISAFIVGKGIITIKDLVISFDFKGFSGNGFYFLAIAILTGIFWSMIFRNYLNIKPLPGDLSLIAFTAVFIGSAEEIIFRGYIQKKLRTINVTVSIVAAAVMHGIYKCSVFYILPPVHPTNLPVLLIWTIGVGCILGILKELSGNTLVPVSAHATFDLLAYGDGVINAWWIWT